MEKMVVNISLLAKCRALFVYDMAILNNKHIVLDDWFWMTLNSYLQDYVLDNLEAFSLIFPLVVDDNKEINIVDLDESQQEIVELYRKYLAIFLKEGNDVLELLNDIGNENVERLSNLAEDFNKYRKVINYVKIKQ